MKDKTMTDVKQSNALLSVYLTATATMLLLMMLALMMLTGQARADNPKTPFSSFYSYAVFIEGYAQACDERAYGSTQRFYDENRSIDSKVRALLLAEDLILPGAKDEFNIYTADAAADKIWVALCMEFRCEGIPTLDCDELTFKYNNLPISRQDWTVDQGMGSLYPYDAIEQLHSIQGRYDSGQINYEDAKTAVYDLAVEWMQ